MTPTVKRFLYLVFIGIAAIVLGVTVAVRNTSVDTELLSYLGVLGGLAIIINAIPLITQNGNGKKDGPP